MENNLRSIIEWSGSSPCGDVNWNTQRQYVKDYSPEVRLLTETWVEMLVIPLTTKIKSCSSPCGDVNWNFYLPEVAMEFYVSLLAGMWVEIRRIRSENKNLEFVSERRRDLKWWSSYWGYNAIGSSPCGDVSCNTESAFKEYLKEGVRSLAETWIEIYDT